MAEPVKNTPANPAPTPPPVPAPAAKATSSAKANPPKKPILGIGKTFTKSDKKAYLEGRGKTPVHILVLKYVGILLFALTWLVYFILKADLDPKNDYLKLFAVQENTFLKHKNLEIDTTKLETDIAQNEAELVSYQTRLEKKQFFEHQTEINDIKTQSTVQWFDTIDDEGNLRMGVFDSLEKLANFFNSRSYNDIEGKDGKITGRQILSRNDVVIENISVDRQNANFSVTGSNIFGKIFFLNTELVLSLIHI